MSEGSRGVDIRFREHFDRFEQLALEFREHHREVIAMHGKIESMNALLTNLAANTNHLKYLEVIADQVITVKDKLLDSATSRRSVSNWTLTLLMGFMFAALFSVTALFLIERVENNDASIMIDALKGRMEVTSQSQQIEETQKKTQ